MNTIEYKHRNSAGFIYSGAGDSDVSPFCQTEGYNWPIRDDPLSDHSKWSPDSHFSNSVMSSGEITHCFRLCCDPKNSSLLYSMSNVAACMNIVNCTLNNCCTIYLNNILYFSYTASQMF